MNITIWNDGATWDQFVENHPDAFNYHRWRWRAAIHDTFGHKPYYLAAVDGEIIRGILPLFEIRSLLFGKSLVSIPFFTYGGVLVDSPEVKDALLDAAAKVALDTGAGRIEIRANVGGDSQWSHSSPKVTMGIAIAPTLDEMFARLHANLRKRVRNARKNGLTAVWSEAEGLDHFYPIFAVNMRNLGTPVYPRKWFESLCRSAQGGIKILTILDDGRPVASAFLSAYRDTLEMPWAASLPESRKKFSPLFMYWSVIEGAHQSGFRKIDLGRSTRDSGNYEFKRHWATDEQPLCWSYWARPGKALPQVGPQNKKFHLAIEVWKRLPLLVANGLGPLVVRSMP